MYLKQDLYDIHNTRLVSKDIKITESVIKELTRRGEKKTPKIFPVKGTEIIKDIDLVFSDERYKLLFNSQEIRRNITEILSQLKLEEPLILELQNIKEKLPYTYTHIQIIAALVSVTVSALTHSPYNPLLAAHLSLTHDIGKSRIPPEILHKTTALTEQEYHIIQTHPTIGYLLLNYYCGWEGKRYCRTAYEHHEKLDGSGYPRGIKNIDPYAQLIAPVDIFDALISDRPYRRTPFDIRMAVDFLLDGVRAKQLNKENVYSLINCLRKHKIYPISAIKVSKKKRGKPPQDSVYGKHVKEATWLKKD